MKLAPEERIIEIVGRLEITDGKYFEKRLINPVTTPDK